MNAEPISIGGVRPDPMSSTGETVRRRLELLSKVGLNDVPGKKEKLC